MATSATLCSGGQTLVRVHHSIKAIIGVTAGNFNALIAGTIILLVVSVVFIIGLFGLMKRMKWAPQLIIAISVANRALAIVLYLISPAFGFWAVWSIILIALSYFDWRKMNTITAVT